MVGLLTTSPLLGVVTAALLTAATVLAAIMLRSGGSPRSTAPAGRNPLRACDELT